MAGWPRLESRVLESVEGSWAGAPGAGGGSEREQALRSYTLDAAYGAFMEDFTGSIEVGKLADFTVLDKDIMTIPEEEILQTQVSMTLLGGKVAYSKE